MTRTDHTSRLSGAPAPALAEARRRSIAELLHATGGVSIGDLEARFGVSSVTVRRDLAHLAQRGLARRTHGGAVRPGVAAGEDAFGSRVAVATTAKQALAAAAADLVSPGQTVYLDSSSTAYFVAEELMRRLPAITIITNSLPIMQSVAAAAAAGVELIGVGGTFRPLNRSFVGPFAVSAIQSHYADVLFMSVKGVAGDGTLTDADQLEAEVKRQMIRRSASPVLLIDGAKVGVLGLTRIAGVEAMRRVVAHGLSVTDATRLLAAGVEVQELTTTDSPAGAGEGTV